MWEPAPVKECWEKTGRGPIGCRWVDIDEGDASRPDVRSRLVVQETKKSGTIDSQDVGAVFAAMPPLECLRTLCSIVMSQPKEKNSC